MGVYRVKSLVESSGRRLALARDEVTSSLQQQERRSMEGRLMRQKWKHYDHVHNPCVWLGLCGTSMLWPPDDFVLC